MAFQPKICLLVGEIPFYGVKSRWLHDLRITSNKLAQSPWTIVKAWMGSKCHLLNVSENHGKTEWSLWDSSHDHVHFGSHIWTELSLIGWCPVLLFLCFKSWSEFTKSLWPRIPRGKPQWTLLWQHWSIALVPLSLSVFSCHHTPPFLFRRLW
jgi:hypothetical protein